MVGRTISHYEIVGTLGEGGMGVVYQARDTRLSRSVALKVLHPSRAADPERRRRFIREAKAASALNHPNIVTIYDIGEEAGTAFIVMEHIVGKPLSELIPRSGMRVNDAIALAIPIADALAKAHSAGIVHRDLKPANLIVTVDGSPKLLDFGVAKLVEVAPADDLRTFGPVENTASMERSAIVGTISYMSPEQAEGQEVDARSDVFSFGAVLYEMVTGNQPFRGESTLATLARILQTDPTPVEEIAPGVPRQLGRLIMRCLRKDKANRWQSIADVRNSLEEIKQDLGSSRDSGLPANVRALLPKHRTVLWGVLTAMALVGAVALWMRPGPDPEQQVEIMAPTSLTSYAGSEGSPSISPDGSQVAFVWGGERQDNRDIYIKRFDSGSPFRLTRDPAIDDHPVWSPDGNSVAFVRRRQDFGGSQTRVITVPALGGSERVLVEGDDIDSGTLDWSPDGKWLVYGQRPIPGPGGLWVRSIESGERLRLTTSDQFDREARFSPSGRSLVFVRGRNDATTLCTLIVDAQMRVTGDTVRVIINRLNLRSPQWMGSGAELVFTAGPVGGGYIERVPATGGRSRRVMTIDAPDGIAVSARTNRLLISRNTSDVDIFRVDLSPDGTKSESDVPVIVSSKYDGYPVYSPNGERIAFASDRSGDWQIWVCDKDGANAIQLTSVKGGEAWPTSWQPADGRRIGFVSNSDGTRRAYMVAAAGGIPDRVPELSNVTSPIDSFWWSPNGSWIVYSTMDEVWKTPTRGGGPIRIGVGGGQPTFDGAGVITATEGPGMRSLDIVPLDGGASRPWGLVYTSSARPVDSVALSVSGSMAYSPSGVYAASNPTPSIPSPLVFLPLLKGSFSGSVPRLSGAAAGFGMSLSPNGHSLLYTKFVSAGADLVLVDHFK